MSIIIAILAIALVTLILKKIIGKVLPGLPSGMSTGSAIFAAIIIWAFIRPYIGVKEPGHWFEMGGNYTTQCMVNAFPNGSKSKNYRAMATIGACMQEGDDGERKTTYRAYYIEAIHWPNGGTLTFADSAKISADGLEWVTDKDGDRWQIELVRN